MDGKDAICRFSHDGMNTMINRKGALCLDMMYDVSSSRRMMSFSCRCL